MNLYRPIDHALLLLFEPACVSCHAPLTVRRTGPVCAQCWSGIQHAPATDEVRAAGLYDGPLRAIVHAFKYRGYVSLARPLGALMRTAAGDWLDDATVVPVPLHPWRSLRRGFNQADLLACTLGRPVWRALRRRRLGPPQAGLSATARAHNLADAYRLRGRARGRVPPYVLLVDDVFTTGATARACTDVLHAAGVETVRVLTLARTLRRQTGLPGRGRPSAARPGRSDVPT